MRPTGALPPTYYVDGVLALDGLPFAESWRDKVDLRNHLQEGFEAKLRTRIDGLTVGKIG